MKAPSQRSRRAFTLIELLVVISIIAILATLLFPAVNAALYSAQKTKAKNDAIQIATAINSYLTEYGKLPTSENQDIKASQATGPIFDALSGSTTSNSPLNPRQIAFMSIPKATADGRNGRVNNQGPYLDPWHQAYFISMDSDYDGNVTGPSGTEENAQIQQTVIVWSKGDKGRTNDYKNPEKWIKSWE